MIFHIKMLAPHMVDDHVIDRINELLQQLFSRRFPDRKRDRVDIMKVLQESRNKLITIWNEKNILVGMGLCIVVNTLSRRTLLLEEIVVDIFSRRKGVGSLIMFQVGNVAKEENVDCIEFNVASENLPAQRLYLKNYYKIRGQVAMGKILKDWTMRKDSYECKNNNLG